MTRYRLLLLVLGVLSVAGICNGCTAFLYDTSAGWPGYPNRVDDHLDSSSW